jgi:signal transduction histidine kinase
MARNLKTISARMVIAVLLIHAVMLPVLSYALIDVVRNAQEEAFIDHVRIYSKVFADLLQVNDSFVSEAEILAGLDSSILGGRCVHAALKFGDSRWLSSLMEEGDGDNFKEDFEFGEHEDNVYYLSAPLQFGDEVAMLELGFDEVPTLLEIASARESILKFVLGYLFVTVMLTMILGTLLSRPIQQLRHDGRQIASGDYSRELSVDSDIFEISELTSDLEHMRSTLVGINARLEEEILGREAAEAEQREVEIHLRHMHRLQSIGTLAGGVAHEFNNVLLPILLYTDLALEDLPGNSPVRPNLERVMRLANRAKGLSDQILTFGRRSGEAMVDTPDVGPIIDEAVSMVRALLPANIEIEFEVQVPVGPIVGNPNEIQQLVVNLCSNASQAIPKSGGRIKVGLETCTISAEFAKRHPRLRQRNYVKLKVADTGEGMDSATLERIFDPFFTTREVGKGSGLGLSVVHGIVVKHDGEIVASSEVDSGTTVDVYFPISDA